MNEWKVHYLSAKIQKVVENEHFLKTNFNCAWKAMLLLFISLYLMKGCAFKEMPLAWEYSIVVMLKGSKKPLMEIQLCQVKERPWGSFFQAKNLKKIFFNNNNNNNSNTIHKHSSTHILGKKSKLLKKKAPIPENNFIDWHLFLQLGKEGVLSIYF